MRLNIKSILLLLYVSQGLKIPIKKLCPEANRLYSEANKLRSEIKIMEDELMNQKKIQNQISNKDKIYNTPEITRFIATTVGEYYDNCLTLDWKLSNNGKAYLKLIDRTGDILGKSKGIWFKKKNRFGIGSHIIINSRSFGLGIKCRFILLSNSDYRNCVYKWERSLSSLKKLNRCYDYLMQTLNDIVITPPKPILPVISTESVLWKIIISFHIKFRQICFRIVKDVFLKCISFIKRDTEKMEKIVDIGKSNNCILINDEKHVINKNGFVLIYGFIPLKYTWGRFPITNMYSCQCVILNKKKVRTGGRSGSIST
tara:strand:- start:833 stop:1774 length:942 start_codon:yes stop_codon:yes gene_type:complete